MIGPDDEARREAVRQLGGDEAGLARLVEAMGDASWRVRKEAVERAAAWPDGSRAAAVLTEALAEPENVGRRNAVVEGLVRLGVKSLGPLVDALGMRPPHRKVIIDSLGRIGDRRATAPLAQCLDDPDPNVRAAAAEALGTVGGADAEATLLRALERGELLLSLACLDGLNRMRARLPVGRVGALAQSAVLRPVALEALGGSADAEAVPYLLSGLAANTRSAREAAAGGLERLHRDLAERGDDDGRRRVEAALRALPVDAEKMLVEALLEAAPASRRSAATLLGWTRRPEAVRALALALADGGVQDAAADAIARIGPGATATLCALAQELDAPLRAAIFSLLPRLGAAAADARVPALLAAAAAPGGDDDPEAAASAARALGELGGRDSLAPLIAALGGPSRVAVAATQALGQLGARYYDEVRMLIAARGLSGGDAPHLCRVLGALGHAEDAPLLLGALHADPPGVRRAAAEALAGLGAIGAEAEDALSLALADEVPEVRAAAARSLGALHAARAVPALAAACADEDPSVRAAAAKALGTLGGAAATGALRGLARSSDGATAVHALEALGRAGDDADEGILVEALVRDDVEVVKAAARALGRLGKGGAVLGLGGALGHSRWDARRAAAQSLGERGGAEALALLRDRGAVEEDGLVKEAIAAAIERAGG